MNADDQRQPFALWLADLARRAGYVIDGPRGGGKRDLARDAGVGRSLVSRALLGEAIPDVKTQRGLTQALRARGVEVTLREMLIRSGLVDAGDLPAADAPPPPPITEIDLHQVARKFGIPPDKIELFARVVESTAQQFADTDTSANVSIHTHARGRSAEGE